MSLVIDDDVITAARLIQTHCPAAKLVAIAEALSALAPVLWGRYGHEDIAPATLVIFSEQKPRAPDGSIGSEGVPTNYSALPHPAQS